MFEPVSLPLSASSVQLQCMDWHFVLSFDDPEDLLCDFLFSRLVHQTFHRCYPSQNWSDIYHHSFALHQHAVQLLVCECVQHLQFKIHNLCQSTIEFNQIFSFVEKMSWYWAGLVCPAVLAWGPASRHRVDIWGHLLNRTINSTSGSAEQNWAPNCEVECCCDKFNGLSISNTAVHFMSRSDICTKPLPGLSVAGTGWKCSETTPVQQEALNSGCKHTVSLWSSNWCLANGCTWWKIF